MRIGFVTDAYDPYISGVVTTGHMTAQTCRQLGHEFTFIVPPDFKPTLKLKELEVVPLAHWQIKQRLEQVPFDAIHLNTEGPLGWAALRFCQKNRLAYTTSYCTQWPQYFQQRYGLPPKLSWGFVRAFHAGAKAVLVPSEAQRQELLTQGFNNVALHGRGFDSSKFHPNPGFAKTGFDALARPIWLSVGRVSKEKNLEEILRADVPGSKVIVGDGPARAELEKKYPQARFLGAKRGEELRAAYAGADYFCFPSRTDTFGLVNIEALACGLPVVSHSEIPIAQLRQTPVTVVAKSFQAAMRQAAEIYADPARRIESEPCSAFARQHFSWEAATRQFISHLVPARAGLSR